MSKMKTLALELDVKEREHIERVERYHADKENLASDPDIKRAIELLDKTGLDFDLTVDGVKLV